jgi:hypothetical protein
MIHKIFKYFIITGLIFVQNIINADQTTELAHILELTQALHTANPNGIKKTITVLKPLTPPSGTATTGTFIATPTTPTTTGMPALSCATPLTDIYVTLTNTTHATSYIFHFDSSVMNTPTIQALAGSKTSAKTGLYVTINVTQASTANAIPVATVTLTDINGNVYASSSSSDPNAAALTSNAEFDYACIGFNNPTPTTSGPAGSTYANWIPLATQNSLLYQQATSQVLPTGNYASLTPPTAPPSTLAITSSKPGYFSGPAGQLFCTNGPFVTTPTTPVVINPKTPLSCKPPLTSINIGLTDYTATTYYAFAFTVANLTSSDPIQATVNITGTASTPVASATITNSSGTVLATSSSADPGAASLPAGTVFAYANFGFNNTDTLNSLSGTTYANWVPLATQNSVLYTQSSSIVLPTGNFAFLSFSQLPANMQTATQPQPKITPPAILTPANPPASNYQPTISDSATFVTTGNSFIGTIINPGPLAISCSPATSLNNITVALLDTSTPANSLTFTFDNANVISKPQIQALMTPGFCIVVNISGSPTVPIAQVAITDIAGNIIASQETKAKDIPSGLVFSYANINFNSSSNAALATFNWLPIQAGQSRVLYKQQPTTVTGTGINSATATMPLTVAKNLTTKLLIPPTTPLTSGQTANLWSNPTVSPKLASGQFPNIFNPRSWTADGLSPANMATATTTPLSCAGGLNSVFVEVTDSTGANYIQFEFDQATMQTPIMQALAEQGLYVSIAFVPNGQPLADNTTAGGNVIQIALCDINGDIFAITTSQYLKPISFMYANIGFNTITPRTQIAAGPSGMYQTYFNWLPINSALPVLYQQTTSNILPTGINGLLTLPVQSQSTTITALTPTNPAAWSSGDPTVSTNPQIIIGTFPITPTINFASPANPTALSCNGPLNNIFVGVTDENAENFLAFVFDSAAVMSQSSMQTLATNGLYVAVSCTANPNIVTVSLCDSTGKAWAQQSYQCPLSQAAYNFGSVINYQFMYANIGFNMPDTLSTVDSRQGMVSSANVNTTETYFNWLLLSSGQPVLYKQGPIQVLPKHRAATTKV